MQAIKILVVDDDTSFIEDLLRRISETVEGVSVLVAQSAHEFFSEFDQNPDIDLIFLGDIQYYKDGGANKAPGFRWVMSHMNRGINNYGRKDNLVITTCGEGERGREMIEKGCHTLTEKNQVFGFLQDFLGV